MEILIKKGSSGEKTTTTIKEIAELIDINNIRQQLQYLKQMIEDLRKAPKVEKDTLIPILKEDFINKGEIVNISFPASVEKDEKIKVGSIYYNKVTDKVRIKKKNGWTDLFE